MRQNALIALLADSGNLVPINNRRHVYRTKRTSRSRRRSRVRSFRRARAQTANHRGSAFYPSGKRRQRHTDGCRRTRLTACYEYRTKPANGNSGTRIPLKQTADIRHVAFMGANGTSGEAIAVTPVNRIIVDKPIQVHCKLLSNWIPI